MSTITATAFGRVLSGFLEERGIEATPEIVGQPVISRMVSTEADYPGSLAPLAEKLELSTEEMQRVAKALAFEEE
jgi:hypothetical protein